jgi:hypothetical protein
MVFGTGGDLWGKIMTAADLLAELDAAAGVEPALARVSVIAAQPNSTSGCRQRFP